MKKVIVAAALLVVIAALGLRAQQPAAPAPPVPKITPVTDAMLQNPDPGDWLMWRRTLDSWGYSPLDQINRSNVAQLRMVWTRGLGPGQPGRHAARPRRRDVRAEPRRLHPRGRREDRRPALGIQAQAAGRRHGRRPTATIAMWGNDAHQLELATTSSTRSTRRPASSCGKRRCSIRTSARPRAAARSSPTAR